VRLLHHSDKPLTAVRSAAQRNACHWKPEGLWVSVEGPGDWRSWCKSENYALDCFEHNHEITLATDARILRLTSIKDVQEFGTEHAVAPFNNIDWKPLAEKYQGIIIAPYQWACRFDEQWYYTWDCASGCIWDASAIMKVERV
jgi:hypothetical protein